MKNNNANKAVADAITDAIIDQVMALDEVEILDTVFEEDIDLNLELDPEAIVNFIVAKVAARIKNEVGVNLARRIANYSQI